MTSIRTMMTRRPALGAGVPVGYGDYRIAVEMLLAADEGALVDQLIVDTGLVSDHEWVDVTQFVNGISIERGATQFGAPVEVGVANIQLRSDDWQFGSWLDGEGSFRQFGPKFDPGLPMRVSVHNDDEWHPLMTGLVESWEDASAEFGRNKVATITIVETVARLGVATVEDFYPIPSIAGIFGNDYTSTGDWVTQLLDAAHWPFGLIQVDGGVLTSAYQFKPQSGAVIAVLRKVVGAHLFTVRSDTTGLALVALQRPATGRSYPFTFNPSAPFDPQQTDIDSEALLVVSDVEAVVNHAISETTEVFDYPSIAKYGIRTVDFGPLATPSQNPLEPFPFDKRAVLEDFVDARAHLTKRLDSVRLVNKRYDLLMQTDIDSPFSLSYTPKGAPRSIEANGFVRGISHQITAMWTDRVRWDATYRLDTYNLTPGSPNPPEAPQTGGETLTYQSEDLTHQGQLLTHGAG